jgi:hypothetical protein
MVCVHVCRAVKLSVGQIVEKGSLAKPSNRIVPDGGVKEFAKSLPDFGIFE